MDEQNEISLKDLATIIKSWFNYFLSKWRIILIAGITFGVIGILYAWYQKPVYTAEITFASESESKGGLGAYAGIAAQFGLDLGGGSSGGAFHGENLLYFMRSRLMVEKALLTPADIYGRPQLLIDYYLNVTEVNKDWKNDPRYKNINFSTFYQNTDRTRDSIFQQISKEISDALVINKVEKRADIISVKLSDTDETFAKVFVEQLVATVIDYYTNYRSEKAKQNMTLLQRQTDSVKRLLTGNITSIAVSNDLNVNPLRQVMRTGVQKTQVDMQVNGALYAELAKNLELSKITLRRETPFMQIIDSPRLPLEKKKPGRFKTGLIGGILGAFLSIAFLLIKKIFSV